MNNPAPVQAAIGHNKPPITAPSEQDWLDDLKARYSEVDTKLAGFKAAADSYPDKIGLDQPDVAEALQDLLGQMAKEVATLEAWEKHEKGQWNVLVNVTKNFFTKPADEIGWKETPKKPGTGLIGKLGRVYKDYLDRKEIEGRKKAAEELERQRAAAAAEQQKAEAARLEREANERRAAEAAAAEQAAREAEAAAKVRREEEERRAESLRLEAQRLDTERRQAKLAEEQQHAQIMRDIKPLLKRAQELQSLLAADEASKDEAQEFARLVVPGGTMSMLAQPLRTMIHLDDEQVQKTLDLQSSLATLRDDLSALVSRAQARRLAAERKAEAEQAERDRLAREEQRQADLRAAEAAKAERDKALAAAAQARQDAAQARQDVAQAKEERRDAGAAARDAGKDERAASEQADRAANRADRQEARMDNAAPADFNRTRADLGTTGGTVRRWTPLIQDEEKLRATLGPLGPHLTSDAISSATTNFMDAHRPSFTGERVDDLLPGVIFTYERDFAIR